MATSSPLVLPDEQVIYWARVYRAMPHLAKHGVTFEHFLCATPQVRASGSLPALAVRERIDQRMRDFGALRSVMTKLERAGVGCANGRFIEKMNHHRYERGARRAVHFRRIK